MPIYEFRCQSCGHVFEELIFRQGEVDDLTCPKCGAQQVGRLLSGFASVSSGRSTSSGGGGGGSCGPGSFS